MQPTPFTASEAFSEESGHFSLSVNSSTQTSVSLHAGIRDQNSTSTVTSEAFSEQSGSFSSSASTHPPKLLCQYMLPTVLFLLHWMQGWKTGILPALLHNLFQPVVLCPSTVDACFPVQTHCLRLPCHKVFPPHCRPQTPPFLVVLGAPLQALKSSKPVTKPWRTSFNFRHPFSNKLLIALLLFSVRDRIFMSTSSLVTRALKGRSGAGCVVPMLLGW